MKNMYYYIKILWEFAENNPEKIKPIHWAIFMVAVERCNRLGWKDKFGMPTDHTMELIGINSRNTYSKAFKELVNFGLIELIQKSTNQSTANIISLPKNDEIPLAQNLSKQLHSDYIATTQRLYHNKTTKTIKTYKDDEDNTDKPEFSSASTQEILISKQISFDQWQVKFKISPERLKELIKEFAEFKERHGENNWKNESDLTKNFEFWLRSNAIEKPQSVSVKNQTKNNGLQPRKAIRR